MSDVIDEIVDNKEKLVETTLENINKINKILMILNQDYIDDSKKLINYVKEISQLYSGQELAPEEDEQDEVAPAAPVPVADGDENNCKDKQKDNCISDGNWKNCLWWGLEGEEGCLPNDYYKEDDPKYQEQLERRWNILKSYLINPDDKNAQEVLRKLLVPDIPPQSATPVPVADGDETNTEDEDEDEGTIKPVPPEPRIIPEDTGEEELV